MWVRRGLAGVVICLAVFLIYEVAEQIETTESPPLSAPSSLSEETDSSIQGFRYRKTQTGTVHWEVEAQTARVHESRHQAILQVVKMTFFQDGAQDMTILANEGIINTATNDFSLTSQDESLSITLSSGYTMYTPHIQWIDNRHEIQTLESILIKGHGLNITGDGLIGYFEDEVFTILKNVRVEVSSS